MSDTDDSGPQPWMPGDDPSPDAKRHAPATARNCDAIIEMLRSILPESGTVLEIASGSGEHVLAFAAAFPNLSFQPSDPDPVALQSIAAYRAEAGRKNVLAPAALDTSARDWPVNRADAILAINMVHISPWHATLGLLDGAVRLLAPNAPLYLYGAYFRADAPAAPSNIAFDQSLRARDANWGIRQLEDVAAEAEKRGLALDRIAEMPANNLSVVFRRR